MVVYFLSLAYLLFRHLDSKDRHSYFRKNLQVAIAFIHLLLNQDKLFFKNKFIYFIYFIFGCVGSSLLCAGFLYLR